MNKYAWRDVIGDTQNVNDNKQRNTNSTEHNDWSWYGQGNKI